MKKLFILFLSFCSLVQVFGLDTGSESLFNEAENRYKNGDYNLSLKLYDEIISQYPMSRYIPDAVFRATVIKVRTGDLSGAEHGFEELDARYSSARFAPYIPFWKGILLYREKKYSDAAVSFSRFISAGLPNFRKESIIYKARCEYELSDINGSSRTLSLLEKEHIPYKKDPAALSFYLFILEQKGDYQKVFALASDVDDKDWSADYKNRITLSVAEAYYKTGQDGKAEQYYLNILSASPEIASVGFIRLFTLYKNNVDRQKEILSRAQAVLSGYPQLIQNFYIHIGIESYKRGDPGTAFSYLSRVWQLERDAPANSLVPLYLSAIYVKQNNRDKAENILKEYLEKRKEKDETVLYTLGNLYVKDSKWPEAEKILSDFINSFPHSVFISKALWMYAYSLYRQDEYASSLAVINKILKSSKAGNRVDSFLRLKSKVLIGMDKPEQALGLLREYIPLHPDNTDAELDYIILSFQSGNYKDVLTMYRMLMKHADTSGASLLGTYIAGIVTIGEGKFKEGSRLLKSIDKKYLLEHALGSIYPYIVFYIGWSAYAEADYKEAVHWFSILTNGYRTSSLYPRALYLSGWSYYLMKEYVKAAQDFAFYSKAAPPADRGKGSYYYGKSMAAKGDTEKAELVFQSIYTSRPDDAYADDALYSHAQLLEELGKDSEAIFLYKKLAGKYTRSPLTEEGLYKIGELYYKDKAFAKARKAFYTYRSHYPNGRLVDASLYWGGKCAIEMGEKYGALLVWEKLAGQYKKSTFRSEILRKIAAIYAEEGEYKKALSSYSDFVLSYPEDSLVKEINLEIKKLKLLQSGLGEREASLLVVIESKGASSREGREASVELASLYLYNDEKKWGTAYKLLKKVAGQGKKNDPTAARAQYYSGEYFSRKYWWGKAVKAFLKAASMDPGDKDLAAVSIYRAAENAVRAGDTATAKKMINLLALNFPSSQWLSEGRKLLEGRQ